MKPIDREKRWVKTKGSRNAAKMWREDLGMWVYVPMYEDRDFNIVYPEMKVSSTPKPAFEPYVINSSEKQKERHRKV